jgi:TonB family protein
MSTALEVLRIIARPRGTSRSRSLNEARGRGDIAPRLPRALLLLVLSLAFPIACTPAADAPPETNATNHVDPSPAGETAGVTETGGETETAEALTPSDTSAEEISELRRRAQRMGASGLVAPVQISTELPEYTTAATEAGIEGDVYIEAVVTSEGDVAEPKLVRGLPDEELNRRALDAITRWKFKPGLKDDEPVPVIALFTVTFRIH